jgi:hypothetical protein
MVLHKIKKKMSKESVNDNIDNAFNVNMIEVFK